MNQDVSAYLSSIENENKKKDATRLLELMKQASGYEAILAGKIVGFGQYHYKYASGHEGDSMVTGFCVQKAKLSLYIMPGFDDLQQELEQLGKHKAAKCCLYINKLADIDEKVLAIIVEKSVELMRKKYDCIAT